MIQIGLDPIQKQISDSQITANQVLKIQENNFQNL